MADDLDDLGFERSYYPALLQLGLTYRCNLTCPHCYAVPHRTRQEFALSEIKDLIQEAAALGTKKIVYSHGENLIRKDFHEAARYISDTGIFQTLMANGFYLQDWEQVVALADTGVRKVMISIDSSNEAEHNRNRGHHRAFSWALQAIRMLKRQSRLEVGISMAIDARNYHTIEEVAELGARLGVDHISFMQVRPNEPNTFSNYNWQGYREICARLYELIVAYRGKVNIYTHDPFMNTIVDERVPDGHMREDYFAHNDCNVGKYMISICPNGDVTACNFIDRVVGNLHERSLAAIWDQIVEDYDDVGKRAGACGSCSKYAACVTGCKAFHIPHGTWIDARCSQRAFPLQ